MACQTPVITFDIGGLSDMVRPEQSGYLVPASNVQQLTTAIQHALTSPHEVRALGGNARQLVLNEFDQRKQADRYTQLYQQRLAR